MKITLDPANPQTWPKTRVDTARLDATTESELAAQQASDDEVAMHDALNAIDSLYPSVDHPLKPVTK